MPHDATVELEILGMRCTGCASVIAAALERAPGVAHADVSYAAGIARVRGEGLAVAPLVAAVAGAGYAASAAGATLHREAWRTELRATVVAAVLALAALLLAPAGAHSGPGGVAARSAGPLLAVLALAWPGRSFLAGAVASLRARAGSMDLLVALGAGAAAATSLLAAAGVVGPELDHGHAAIELVALLRLGKLLEARVRARTASRLLSLLDLLPARARRLAADGSIEEVAALELAPGDRVEVAPGERLPADGLVEAGRSCVDESATRGEPLPVDVAPGDAVAAGSINLQAPLRIVVRAAGPATQLGQTARLVRDALARRAPIVTAAERAAAWFVPGVVLASVGTAAGWWLAGAPAAQVVGRALATVVVSCPCALALATPAALVAGVSGALRRGVLVKEAALLDALLQVRVALLDKTGTLTVGELACGPASLDVATPAQRESLRALASASRHPAARAVAAVLEGGAPREGAGTPHSATLAAEERPGLGVRAATPAGELRLGRLAFALEGGGEAPAGVADLPSVVAASLDGRLIAAWPLLDRVRESAAATVAGLRARGLDVELVTGDRRAAALALAGEVGLEPGAVAAECTPERKAARVAQLEASGSPVLFVGDGFNDAGALALARVGAAMGGRGATDLARAAGGLVLLRGDPADVVAALDVARATRRVVRQNLVLAAAYNAFALPWAMGLLARFAVAPPSPTLAGLAMAASSLAVVANSLRLARGGRHAPQWQ